MSKTQRELKELRQQQREEVARRQRARERRSLLIIAGSTVLALLLILGVALYLRAREPHHIPFVAVRDMVGQQVENEGAGHVPTNPPPQYKHYPPTSGPHYGTNDGAPVPWQTIGQLSEGFFVHNLEHGGIAVLYNCPSGPECDKLRSKLTNYVQNQVPQEPQFHEYKIVMTPYSQGMTHKIALVAWDWIDEFDSYDEGRITRFYESHVNQAPEKIP